SRQGSPRPAPEARAAGGAGVERTTDMIAKRFACIALLLTTVAVAGCGTACNLLGPRPVPYGGVSCDLATAAGRSGCHIHVRGWRSTLLLLGLGAAELACTAAGDTMTLPLVEALNRRA